MRDDRITLHGFRWPFAAGRAGVYLAVLVAFGGMDPVPGTALHPPRTVTARRFPLFERDIAIEIGRSGRVLAGRYYGDEEFAERLVWLHAANPRSRLVVRVEGRIPFGEIRKIVRAAQRAHYQRFTIETSESRPYAVRRLEDLTAWRLDDSSVVQPPLEDGMSFEILHVWD